MLEHILNITEHDIVLQMLTAAHANSENRPLMMFCNQIQQYKYSSGTISYILREEDPIWCPNPTPDTKCSSKHYELEH